MGKPVLSILIPTFNRRKSLGRLLDSIGRLHLSKNEFEVLVIDNGSTDQTQEVLADRRDAFALKIISLKASVGPSAARNRGAREAKGKIIGLLDSDVTIHPDWWQIIAPHFEDGSVGAVEGATLLPPGSPWPTPFTHFVHNCHGGSYQSCNFVCRAEVFHRVGGFEERFYWKDAKGKIWHVREDTDFAFSILENGFRIEFEPRAVAWHPLVPVAKTVYWRETHHAFREPLLRRRHPEQYAKQLNWINGRAFPAFYWGIYAGLPAILLGAIQGWQGLVLAGWGGVLAGWIGSVYARCRKRRVRMSDVLWLAPQFLAIPWLRLYWLLRGEWDFRHEPPAAKERI